MEQAKGRTTCATLVAATVRPGLFESFVGAASGKNAQRAVTLAGAHQLGGSTQGCAGAGTGGDAVIEQHLPCGALGIGRGDRQHAGNRRL